MLGEIHRLVENAALLRVSQRELCARAGVAQSTVAKWLNGQRVPQEAELRAVLRRLQGAMDEILAEVEAVLRRAQGQAALPAGAAAGGAAAGHEPAQGAA